MVAGVAAAYSRLDKPLPPMLPLLRRHLAQALYPVLVEILNLAGLSQQRCCCDLRTGHPLQPAEDARMGDQT